MYVSAQKVCLKKKKECSSFCCAVFCTDSPIRLLSRVNRLKHVANNIVDGLGHVGDVLLAHCGHSVSMLFEICGLLETYSH